MLPNPARDVLADGDPAFEELKSFLVNATGNFRLSGDSSPVLEKVRNRLRQSGLASLGEYLDHIRKGEAGKRELDSLIAELTVGETFFFRHPDHFDALRDHVLPACLARNAASRQLRIWSAGCSNGAEAYSIAIVVRSILGDRLKDWNITIVGSDINRAFLAEAEVGTYSAWTLRGLDKDQLPGFFTRNGQTWSVLEKYKEHVHFVYHNLINEELPSIHKNIFAFDIVFCRNVMIYFNDATNQRLVERLNAVMVDDGWLFVGSTDFNPHLDRTFTSEKRSGAIIFRKQDNKVAARSVAPVVSITPRSERPARPSTPPAPRRRAAERTRVVRTDGAHRIPGRRPDPSPVPSHPDLAAIVDLANRGKWDEAARHCQAALSADPVNAPAHYYYALVLQSTGATTEAEAELRRAIYLDRGFALAHYQLGLARKDAHDLTASARAFRNVLELLAGAADDRPASPCGRITVADLRELATQQIDLLSNR